MTACSKCGHQFPGDVECIAGIAIDYDEFFEGWQTDVSYPPAPCHPGYCKPCKGTGDDSEGRPDSDDCRHCGGTGYAGGKDDCQERLNAAAA